MLCKGLLLGSASGLLFFIWQLETDVSIIKQNTWASTDEKFKQTRDRKAEGTRPRGTVFKVPEGIVDITGEKEEENTVKSGRTRINCVQYPVINDNGKILERMCVYMYIHTTESLYCIAEISTF